MLRDEIDIAVHSMKDVPTDFPEGLGLYCITEREDPRDAVISRNVKFADLPQGARIGTSALRRQAQLLKVRPDLQMCIIRGNVETRIRKLDDDKLDAVISGCRRSETSRFHRKSGRISGYRTLHSGHRPGSPGDRVPSGRSGHY